MSDLPSTDEDVGLAAEYALGVLDRGERESAQRRLAADAGFATEVRAWEDRLHPLSDHVAAQAPSPELWRRVSASVAARPARSVRAPERRPSLWSSLAFWRGATAGMGALAAAAVAFAVLQPSRTAVPAAPAVQPPMMVARLAGESGPPMFVVAYDPARKSALVTPLTVTAPAGRTHQLWLIPVDGGAPVSLGLVRLDRAEGHAMPDALRPLATDRATIAVSMEPAGGSPTGAPTGPVVASGPLGTV